MSEGKVYHLWLMPQAETSDYLAGVIGELSRAYQTRVFEPHVTLLGRVVGPEAELLAKTEKLAAYLSRITVSPIEIQHLNEFYRSLFLRVTLTDPLRNANKLAKQLFGLPLNLGKAE